MGREQDKPESSTQENDGPEKRPDAVEESDEESFPASDPPESYQVD